GFISAGQKVKIFISYTHRDEATLERLHVHLAMLRRDGIIDEWYDREILGGATIDEEVERNLNTSEIFVALVTPDFLNSDYCYDTEMAMAIEKHGRAELQIVPVVAEPCDWQNSPLRRFKALPKDGRPISEWRNE